MKVEYFFYKKGYIFLFLVVICDLECWLLFWGYMGRRSLYDENGNRNIEGIKVFEDII